MTIVTTSTPAPKSPGRPRGSRGNGKSAAERIARAKRDHAVEQNRLELEAQAARAQVAAQIEKRRLARAERVHALYDAQEARRAPQAQIDQKLTLYILVGLTIVTFITTAVLTADGTIGAAAAAQFAFPWFGFILFGAFEIAILAFMLMYYILGSRIDYEGNRVKSAQWFVAMIVAATITVGLSVYHVLDIYEYAWLSIDMWVGIGIRLTVAVFFVLVSKGLASTVFARAIHL